jgi:hypothetical protein
MISCTTSCRRVLVAVLNERGSPADVIGLSSNNLVPFSPNVVLSTRIFSANPVPKKRMFSVPAIYVLGPLHLHHRGEKLALTRHHYLFTHLLPYDYPDLTLSGGAGVAVLRTARAAADRPFCCPRQ